MQCIEICILFVWAKESWIDRSKLPLLSLEHPNFGDVCDFAYDFQLFPYPLVYVGGPNAQVRILFCPCDR